MKNPSHAIAALSLTLPADGGTIQLFPAGTFDAPRGALAGKGPWRLDAAAAKNLIDKVAKRRNDIVVDYEHQTLLSAENGKPAPAAGWIKPDSLRYDENSGLFAASVKWTDAARQAIAADEYRYLSPVFAYSQQTGAVTDLINVALVNAPAIDGMDKVTLAAASIFYYQPDEDSPVDITQLKKLLGLADTATDEELTQAIAALKAKAASADAKDTEIAALKGASPDPAKFAPIGVVTELQTELAALKTQQDKAELDRLIQSNLAKLPTPQLQEWAATMSVAALKAYLEKAPEIGALKGMQTQGKDLGAGNAHGLSDEELAVCKQLGYNPEAYAKTKGGEQ
jgi:phage I-like protein